MTIGSPEKSLVSQPSGADQDIVGESSRSITSRVTLQTYCCDDVEETLVVIERLSWDNGRSIHETAK